MQVCLNAPGFKFHWMAEIRVPVAPLNFSHMLKPPLRVVHLYLHVVVFHRLLESTYCFGNCHGTVS